MPHHQPITNGTAMTHYIAAALLAVAAALVTIAFLSVEPELQSAPSSFMGVRP